MLPMLFRAMQKASISRYISFSKERLPPDEVKALIKEMQTVGYINMSMLNHWRDLMREHNQILARGQRLGLSGRTINTKSRLFSSLDLYMLQMQSKYLAEILDDFSRFAERVMRCIAESPASRMWVVSGAIIIERSSWMCFCQQVVSLLHTIGIHCPVSKVRLDPWPDRKLLESSAARAQQMFGSFASAPPGLPTIFSLLCRGYRRNATKAALTRLQYHACVKRPRTVATAAAPPLP